MFGEPVAEMMSQQPQILQCYFIKTTTHLKATHRSPNKLSTLVQYNCLIQRLHPTFAKSLPLSVSFLIRDPILENMLYFAVLPVKTLSFLFFKFYFSFKLYNIVLVLPNIEMNPPQVYMCSPS